MDRMTRAIFARTAGALTVFGALLLGTPAHAAPVPPPQPLPPQGSLAVSPGHGRPTAPVTAVFRVVPAPPRCPLQARFQWDGQLGGSAPLGPACAASLTFAPPPVDRTPGPHTVTAAAADGLFPAS